MSKLSDPLKAATYRGLLRRHEMLKAGGGTLTTKQVANFLGLSAEAVDRRRASNQLLAVPRGDGFSYPGFQFDEGKTLPGMEDVLRALSAVDPLMQLLFFNSANERLDGRTPIEALRQGELERVVEIANIYGEQGAL
jgi:hypothetical protein